MPRVLSTLALIGALSFGCTHSNSPSGMLPLSTTLSVGQQATLSGLTVTFVAVTADSRCPIDANCFVAGDATLQFNLSANQRTARVDLQVERTDKSRATHENYVFGVQTLTPYPSASKPITQADYRATVLVSR